MKVEKNWISALTLVAAAVMFLLSGICPAPADDVKKASDIKRPSAQVAPVQPQTKALESAPPSQQGQRTALSVPAAPTGLTAVSPNGTKVILAWKDNSGNEKAFAIERKVSSGTFQKINTAMPNITNVSDDKVTLNTTYTYRVQAYNDVGTSPYSNEATVTVKLPAVSGEIIQCPVLSGSLNFMVNSQNVPAGWQAPNYGASVNFVFNSASVFDNRIVCSYLVPVGSVSINRPYPAGKTCKAVDNKYFICE